jgi:putative ABC transport system permease protein
MAALGIRFRAELRSRWRAWLALVLLAAAAGGLLVAMAAASRRTATAFERFLAATNAADAYVGWGVAFGGGSLDVDRIARLPQVAASQRRLLLAVIARSRSGRSLYPVGPGSLEVQVPTDGHPNAIDRPKLLHGRLPDPSRPNEVLADTRSIRYLGLSLRDATAMRFISRRALLGDEPWRLTVDPRKARVGRLVRVRIVGVEAYWHSDVDSGYLHLTPAFYRAYGGRRLGSWAGQLQVRLRRGEADLPAFKAAVQRIAGKRGYAIFEPSATLPKVQRSIDLQARALLLLTAFGAAAALLLVGQALFRQALLEAAAHPTLRALGMTRAQLMALGTARAAAIALPAAVLTVLLAFLLSPLAPVGRARELEPDPGFDFNASVLAPSTAAVLAAILVIGVLGTARAVGAGGAAARPRQARRRGAVWSALARAGWPPPAVAGVRMALQRGPRPTAVPVRATLVAATLAVGIGAAALTFAASLQHLLDTPRLYGQTWDFETGGGGPPIDAATVRRISRDPAFSDVAIGAVEPVEMGGQAVGARAMTDVKGSSAPTVLDGRAPRAPGEVLLGTKTLGALHLGIGDRVSVRSGPRAVRLRIVGRGVLPSTKYSKLSEGAAFSFHDLKRVRPEAAAYGLQARIAPRADRDSALRRLALILDAPSVAVRPTDVGDFGGVEALPLLIIAAFAGAAAAALAHALVTSVRRRRRELAILKTLGFTRAQVFAALAAQATTVAAIGLLIGLPLGVGIGRFAWNVFAEDLGVVPEAVTPIGLTALVVPATIVLANLIAALPARTAARTEPALVLRAE